MRPAELPLNCERCGSPAEYYDSAPDARLQGCSPAECGYRLVPLCWLHAVEQREVATSRVEDLLRCESQGLARVDRGRASGLCRCGDCRRLYYDHPADADYPYLHVLCDGSVVKL